MVVHYVDKIPEHLIESFKKNISKSKGKVIVLVHPFYSTHLYQKKYEARIHKLLSQKETPVIVLESERELSLQGYYTKYFHHLFLPTEADSPSLILSNPHFHDNSKIDKTVIEFDNLEGLSNLLVKFGAKTILIGGQKALSPEDLHPSSVDLYSKRKSEVLVYEKSAFPHRLSKSSFHMPIMHGCAGFTYSCLILSKQFDKIRWLNEAMAPRKPTYYKNKIK